MYNDKAEVPGSPYTICLAFVRTNVWGAQIYKDPDNQWLVKIETHATTFDATPRVAFQGNGIYIAQNGSSFIVVDDSEQVDKFGTKLRENQLEPMVDGPPFRGLENMNLVATWEVRLVPTDDQTKEIYRREVGDSYTYYFALANERYTTRESRNLYIYILV